ncbi:MAG: ankyrin repeat-containing domain protein [Monoraphidium minutum]|nr:MAG: ankyrin repeat-containing domain protein [Monoraphidium minutum]
MGSTMADLMARRQRERQDAYDAQWDGGRGSHHPDYDPTASGPAVAKASRATEELYLAIVEDDVARVYEKIEEGADVGFVFGAAYKCPEGYTPLMVAAHRGRLECAKALLRAGADPNYVTGAGDLSLFWAVDGGPEMIQLFARFGADLDAASPKGWTALSYARAKGKYGATEEAGIYPEDVLLYYGATKAGSGPPALGVRSPRASFDPEAATFARERGSYQRPIAAP